MNRKILTGLDKSTKEQELIKNFLGHFNYLVKNNSIRTIANLIRIIINTKKYPLHDLYTENKATFKDGLNFILSRDYHGKIRNQIKKTGFLNTADYLNYYLNNSDKPIRTEGNCYELCYLVKDFLEFIKTQHQFNNIRYRLIYTSTKHLFLQIEDEQESYDFDPDKNSCYFGPSQLNSGNTAEMVIKSEESAVFLKFFQSQILYSQSSYQEARKNLFGFLSPTNMGEKLLEKILKKLSALEETKNNFDEEDY